MEASRILSPTETAGPAARWRPLLRYEDELLFAADPRSCAAPFADACLRMVRCDGSNFREILPETARATLFAEGPGVKTAGLARGDLLFVLLDAQGALLHHSFVQFGAAVLALLGEARAVPLIGRCATMPAARGRRLYPRTLCHIMSELAAAGHRRVAIYCDRDNAASIRGIRHAGFSAVAHLRTLVIGERWAMQWRRPGGVRLIALCPPQPP
jgi:hypothetical protein